MSTTVPPALLEAMIVEATGWTHEQYLAQPQTLINALWIRVSRKVSADTAARKQFGS